MARHPATAPPAIRISELARRAGVPAATIKHYLREGLFTAARRTSPNMAYYDPRLVERVRTIKALQTQRFLPLRLIGELLEREPSAQVRADAEDTLRRHLGRLEPAIRAGSVDAQLRRGRTDASRSPDQLQVTPAELRALARIGLAEPGPDGNYRGADLELLEIMDETRRRGLGELFSMEILGPYAVAVGGLVRLELDLFKRRVLESGARPPRPLDEIARDATRLGERLIVALRAKLVIAELKKLSTPAGGPDAPTSLPRARRSRGPRVQRRQH